MSNAKAIGQISPESNITTDRFIVRGADCVNFEAGMWLEFSAYQENNSGCTRTGHALVRRVDRDTNTIYLTERLYTTVPSVASNDHIFRAEPPAVSPEDCAHNFKANSFADAIVCGCCALSIPAEALAVAGFSRKGRYSAEGNALADEAQRLRDEFAETARENVALRREVETLRRKVGKR